ncbi:hypothetical protein ES705_11847 [subsurface metagenome]|jgi:hypothetical protein
MVRRIFQKLENGHEQEYGKQYDSIEMLTNLARIQLVGAIKLVKKCTDTQLKDQTKTKQ